MRVCAGARSVLPILLPVTHGLHGFRYLALHTTGRVPASVWEHRAAFEAHCSGLPLRVNLPRRAEPRGSLRFHCASAPAVASEWGPRSCQAATGVRARQGCRGLATSAPGGTPGLCAGALRVRPRSSPSVLPVGDAPCPPLLLPPLHVGPHQAEGFPRRIPLPPSHPTLLTTFWHHLLEDLSCYKGLGHSWFLAVLNVRLRLSSCNLKQNKNIFLGFLTFSALSISFFPFNLVFLANYINRFSNAKPTRAPETNPTWL